MVVPWFLWGCGSSHRGLIHGLKHELLTPMAPLPQGSATFLVCLCFSSTNKAKKTESHARENPTPRIWKVPPFPKPLYALLLLLTLTLSRVLLTRPLSPSFSLSSVFPGCSSEPSVLALFLLDNAQSPLISECQHWFFRKPSLPSWHPRLC